MPAWIEFPSGHFVFNYLNLIRSLNAEAPFFRLDISHIKRNPGHDSVWSFMTV